MASNMVKRVAFAAVAIPVAGAVVWQGGLALAALLALAGWLGCRELLQFAWQKGLHPWRVGAILSASALPLLAWAAMSSPAWAWLTADWVYLLTAWLLVMLLGTLWLVKVDQRPLPSAAVSLLAPLYAGGLPAFLLVLRHGAGHGARDWAGVALAFLPLALTWACDSLAMEVGRRVGGPRLAPNVSPGKTWAGTIGGVIGALAAAPLYHTLVLAPVGSDLTPWHLLVVGAMVGTVGQLGDLVESLFKREAGVKDSSHLLPGHGGVLDRLDSLYFTLPLTAVLLRVFGVL